MNDFNDSDKLNAMCFIIVVLFLIVFAFLIPTLCMIINWIIGVK